MGRDADMDFMESAAMYQAGEDMSIPGWEMTAAARKFVPGRREEGAAGRRQGEAGREWSSDDIDDVPPDVGATPIR